MAKGESYEEFVNKFKRKKTTDDCFTPPIIYDAVKDFVVAEYKLQGRPIVRPFYPGGGFENCEYPDDCVVIDNPPFSILKKIKDFYNKKRINFFLFAPSLTIFSSNEDGVCYYITNTQIEFENKAIVNTGFVTNLEKDYKIIVCPKLAKIIDKANKKNKRIMAKYQYPKNVIRSSMFSRTLINNQTIKIKPNEIYFIRRLDQQKQYNKNIYGAGFLTTDKIADKIKGTIKDIPIKDITENTETWELSDREKAIIDRLNKSSN